MIIAIHLNITNSFYQNPNSKWNVCVHLLLQPLMVDWACKKIFDQSFITAWHLKSNQLRLKEHHTTANRDKKSLFLSSSLTLLKCLVSIKLVRNPISDPPKQRCSQALYKMHFYIEYRWLIDWLIDWKLLYKSSPPWAVCLFVRLVDFLTSSSTTSYIAEGSQDWRLTILSAATHETERGDHDFCLSWSNYTDTYPTSRERAATAGIEPGTFWPGVTRSTDWATALP